MLGPLSHDEDETQARCDDAEGDDRTVPYPKGRDPYYSGKCVHRLAPLTQAALIGDDAAHHVWVGRQTRTFSHRSRRSYSGATTEWALRHILRSLPSNGSRLQAVRVISFAGDSPALTTGPRLALH